MNNCDTRYFLYVHSDAYSLSISYAVIYLILKETPMKLLLLHTNNDGNIKIIRAYNDDNNVMLQSRYFA